MSKFRKAIIVAAALTLGQTTTANAADLLPPVVAPVPIPEPVSAPGAFYLRSFIGMTNHEVDDITNEFIAQGNFTIIDLDFDSSPFIGLGFGYEYSDKFRFDVTGEYRGKSDFTGLDTYTDGANFFTNEYTARKSEWLFLANGYWDIGTWHGFTPYVGAGIGTAAISIDGFKDVNLVNNGLAFASDNTEWNFAWALHAGFSYDLTDDLKFDFGYRYTDLGDAKTGTVRTYDPSVGPFGPTKFKDITSHDVHVGLRWSFGGGCCAVPIHEPVPISYK